MQKPLRHLRTYAWLWLVRRRRQPSREERLDFRLGNWRGDQEEHELPRATMVCGCDGTVLYDVTVDEGKCNSPEHPFLCAVPRCHLGRGCCQIVPGDRIGGLDAQRDLFKSRAPTSLECFAIFIAVGELDCVCCPLLSVAGSSNGTTRGEGFAPGLACLLLIQAGGWIRRQLGDGYLMGCIGKLQDIEAFLF